MLQRLLEQAKEDNARLRQENASLKAALNEARHEASEWEERAHAVHGVLQELTEQIRRNDFVRARHATLVTSK